MIKIDLPAEVESFARQCVTDGRFQSLDEVVASAIQLLRDHDEAKRRFTAMLEEAEAEGDREGWISADELDAELAQIMAEAKGAD